MKTFKEFLYEGPDVKAVFSHDQKAKAEYHQKMMDHHWKLHHSMGDKHTGESTWQNYGRSSNKHGTAYDAHRYARDSHRKTIGTPWASDEAEKATKDALDHDKKHSI